MTVNKVKFVEVDEHHAGQRIDNFLLSKFAKVPRSRVYRALRSGEVRVNKGRVKPVYRIQLGDIVRFPPIDSSVRDGDRTSTVSKQQIELLENQIIYENEYLLVLNKPAGIAAHSGSGDATGVIEIFRASREHQPYLELAHRIDKHTSGCLVLAKTRRALLDLQSALQTADSEKEYAFLVQGRWQVKKYHVTHALEKQESSKAEANTAAKMVAAENGKHAETIFNTREIIGQHSLLNAKILTGRTHQIRVHAQQEGHPIAGDTRYGDYQYNRQLQRLGLKRMFLHAQYLKLRLDSLSQTVEFRAPLPNELVSLCKRLRKGE